MEDDKGTHIATNNVYISDDPTWTSGDFTLISTDGVRFRVPSCFILASR